MAKFGNTKARIIFSARQQLEKMIYLNPQRTPDLNIFSRGRLESILPDFPPKRYQTIYDLSQEESDNLKASRVSQELKPIRDSLKQIQRNVEDFINSLHPFSNNEFGKDFILDHPDFRQRKFFQPLPSPFKIECDIETYNNKFPIFKKPAPAQDGKSGNADPPRPLVNVFKSR